VLAAVAGGGDEDVPLGRRVADRVGQGGAAGAAAVAVVRDAGAHVRGVVDGLGRAQVGAAAVGVEELQGHDLHLPVDPDHPIGVVVGGERRVDRAIARRDVGPVGVDGVAAGVDVDVQAVGVERVEVVEVDDPVAVGVDQLGRGGRQAADLVGGDRRHEAGGDLAVVQVDVQVEVGVVEVGAGVDVGDDDLGRAGGGIPGRRRVDAVGAVEPPEVAGDELRVVGGQVGVQGLQRLDVADARPAGQG